MSWKLVQGGKQPPAPSRDGANASVGHSEVQAGPGLGSLLQPPSPRVIAVN